MNIKTIESNRFDEHLFETVATEHHTDDNRIIQIVVKKRRLLASFKKDNKEDQYAA